MTGRRSTSNLRAAVAALLATTISCSDDDSNQIGPGGGSGGSGGTSAGRVSFAETCAPPPDCGGDPIGTWTLVEACVSPPDGGFHCADGLTAARGTTTGVLTLGPSDFSFDLDSELRQCGWVDGSSSSDGGSYTVAGNVLNLGGVQAFSFCVEDSTLWLYDPTVSYPELRMMMLTRDTLTP